MADIPELSYGIVRGRYLAGILDGADLGNAPDGVPMSGYVVFNATASAIKVAGATPDPATVFPTNLRVELDAEGYLSHNGSRDIALWATDDPDGNPVNWQWRVSFFLRFERKEISYPSFNFTLSDGQEVDLTTVAPVAQPSPGVYIIRGLKGDNGGIMSEEDYVALIDEQKGEAGGLPTLDEGSRIPESQLPAYLGQTELANTFAGAHAQNVSGSTSLPVTPNHLYELTATSTAAVTLSGATGAQVAIRWAGAAGTVEGQAVSAGQTWVAVHWASGWVLYEVGGSGGDPATPVTATVPTFDDATSTIVLSAVDGVQWRVDGVVKPAGSVPVDAPATVTVTATALSGYVLVGTSSWSHSFPAPTVTPTAPDELADLIGWYDPSDSGSVTLDGEGRPSSVDGQNAGSLPIAQTTAANRPFMTTMNGIGAFKTDSAVNNTQNLSTGVLPQPWSTSATVFGVARCDNNANPWNSVFASGSLAVYLNSTQALVTGNPVLSAATAMGRTYFLALSQDSDTGTARLYIDGVEVASGARAATLSTFGISGSSGTGNSTIGDIGMYGRALPQSEINSLYLWAKGKWGLP